jgi:hypothetical protein
MRPSSTWSCTSSIWKVPPLGRERISARVTWWVSASTSLAYAGRRRALGSVNRQKGFHQCNRDFIGLERYDCAIATNDLVVRQ